MGPEILSSTGAGVWRKAPMAFPEASSVLDKCRSAISGFKKPLKMLGGDTKISLEGARNTLVKVG